MSIDRAQSDISFEAVVAAIRAYFDGLGFAEVETAEQIAAPAPEEYIDLLPAGNGLYFRASPELQMKQLLAAGAEKIYQIGPCWRANESGPFHRTCFTMLEWYRANATSAEILADTRNLLAFVARETRGQTTFSWQGMPLDVSPAGWQEISVQAAFQRWAGWDPIAIHDADRFDMDLVSRVEPALPKHVPVVLKDYPARLASLARTKPENPALADRWEVYLCGLELANAYGELTDPEEQRARFEAANRFRQARGAATYPLDEAFLSALAHMPPSSGIALGVDRLHLLLADLPALPPLETLQTRGT